MTIKSGNGPPTASRERLLNRRASTTFSFKHNDVAFTATTSRYSDGRLAEIFIDSNKAGSDLDAVARDAAVVCSIALQYGAPAEVIRTAATRRTIPVRRSPPRLITSLSKRVRHERARCP